MTNATFKIIAKYWNEWARQSIKLVGDCSSGEDEPRLRSRYILLSYALELMVKSRLVAVRENITEEDLIKNYGHNFRKILKELESLGELEKIGIKSLPVQIKPYIYSIETTSGEIFYIYDFTNIRYYPKQEKNQWDTEEAVLNTAKIMLEISEKIHKLGK